MIVMKFGGTSIQDTSCIRRVGDIISKRLALRPILIFSAMGKITRNLLHTAQFAAAGNFHQAEISLEKICHYHLELRKAISKEENAEPSLIQYCQELKQIINDVFEKKELTPKRQDKVLAYGELMATSILTHFLQMQGIPAVWVDARSLIITDDAFTKASPIRKSTDQKLKEKIKPLVDKGSIPVIQGFIGSTVNGETTTLGFEGSDFTASIIGSSLNVSDIQIWKDVSGIMTADPNVISHPHTVREISYAEAEKLTQGGAKVLHPKTLAPAREKAIPVHIYNSRKPDEPGTVITLKGSPCSNPVKSIACKQGRCVIKLECSEINERESLLLSTRNCLENRKIHTFMITQKETEVILSIDHGDKSDELITDLNKLGEMKICNGKAAITLVGADLLSVDGFKETLLQMLDGQPVEGLQIDDSGDMCILFVNEEHVQDIINLLHKFLFRSRDPNIFN